MNIPNARDCKHGQLARSCEICELERERDELKKHLAEHQALVVSVMPKVAALIEAERERRRLAEDDCTPEQKALALYAVQDAFTAILQEPAPALEGFDEAMVQVEPRSRIKALEDEKGSDAEPWTPASWAKFQYFADTWCVDCRHWQRCQKLQMVPGEPVSGWSVDECGWTSCAGYERDREDAES